MRANPESVDDLYDVLSDFFDDNPHMQEYLSEKEQAVILAINERIILAEEFLAMDNIDYESYRKRIKSIDDKLRA